MNLEYVWIEFLKIVSEEIGSRVVETWFKAVILTNWDPYSKTVFLKAPNNFVKDWITTNYKDLLKKQMGRLFNEKEIKIIFLDHAVKEELKIEPAVSLLPNLPVKENKLVKKSGFTRGLNQNYQFDTFVVGPNTALAFAAAQAVSEKPGSLYNPLFIYGSSGLGKTHLLHAIAHELKEKNSKIKILYQSADKFVNEFIGAIRFDKVSNFENRYKTIDILLIDDIQFISNKEQTQEAFFHIFNTLYESKKQIVFSSDSLPKDIEGLADRLKSRLDGGLITDIQPATLETKIAILKKKAELHQIFIPDEVAHFIAKQSSSNIRQMEGYLIRALAFASLMQEELSLEIAQKALAGNDQKELAKKQTIDLNFIAAKVSKHYNYTVNDLRSNARLKSISLARHMAMYLMKKHTKFSLADIGAFWRRKDHSTVLYAISKIEKCQKLDNLLKCDLEKIESKILSDN